MAEKTVRVEGTVSVGSDTGLIVLNADKSTTPTTTLSAATTGTGTAVDFGRAQSNITMAVLVTGTVTGGVVALDVSQDAANWIQFQTNNLATNTNSKIAASSEAWRYARGRVTTNVTGGATVTCTLMSGG